MSSFFESRLGLTSTFSECCCGMTSTQRKWLRQALWAHRQLWRASLAHRRAARYSYIDLERVDVARVSGRILGATFWDVTFQDRSSHCHVWFQKARNSARWKKNSASTCSPALMKIMPCSQQSSLASASPPLAGVEGACFFRCAAPASGLPLGICTDVAPQADRFWQALMLAAHIEWATDVPGGR